MAAFNVVLGCVMALLLLLYTISSSARYHIKFTTFILLALVFATLPMPLMLFKIRDPRNALIPAYFLRKTAWLLGVRWKVRGLENIDNSRGAVILLNHQTGLDLFVLAVLWPLMARCTVVSKKALLYLVPFGTAAWLWGTVFIDRASTKTARASVNREAEAVRERKILPGLPGELEKAWRGVCPEVDVYTLMMMTPVQGTRHMGDKLLPFRKGAFHAALDAQAPIQPVVVSRYHFIDSKRKRFGSGELIITILPLIETETLSKDDIPLLVEKTHELMQDTFTQTTAETLANIKNKSL